MANTKRLGLLVLVGCLTISLVGCTSTRSAPASDEPTQSDMSAAQRKATVPDLRRDAEAAANGMLDLIGSGDTEADPDDYLKTHPLAAHHHLGTWKIKDTSDGTGTVTGSVCVEYRPTVTTEPVAMATVNVQYRPASGSLPADGHIGFAGRGLNVAARNAAGLASIDCSSINSARERDSSSVLCSSLPRRTLRNPPAEPIPSVAIALPSCAAADTPLGFA